MMVDMTKATTIPLDRDLRNQLERVVVEARDESEAGAQAALEQLGVGEPTPYAHLTPEERDLRRRLRAHGRSLGDERQVKGVQETLRLMEEIAYQHWHRMLFARFLAENNLLMYPDPDEPVAVSLEECEEVAAGQGAKNGWELAARYAARMLPQIFRPDSPVFELEMPPEHQQALEQLVADLPQEVFNASDSLGWVYQFWQSKKKDEVNASEVKIGARELPAVTQLFTEPYMVSFLLDNSLGAWWAARRLTEQDLKTAESEEELRAKASLPGVPLEYLRFVKQDEDDEWAPAAGTFDGWPEHLSELKTLDPCCGSGHFLVAALGMLVPMRMELEGLSALEAIDAVLREKLHGLDIDKRVTEIAAFALAFAAWRYPEAGGYRALPELNIACSGLAISAKKEEWLELAGEDKNLRIALEELYEQFRDAPVLGSLIDPRASLGKDSLFEVEWGDVEALLTLALSVESDEEKNEMGTVARGIVKAAWLLASKFDWIITNVPFLGFKRQEEELRQFCEINYPNSESGLETVFIERMLKLTSLDGVVSFVSNQTWTFQPTSMTLREDLLNNYTFSLVARLGSSAFETITGEVVNVCLTNIVNRTPYENDDFLLFDLQKLKKPEYKARELIIGRGLHLPQLETAKSPGSIISALTLNEESILSKSAKAASGLKTGDRVRFNKYIWEVDTSTGKWDFYQVSSKAKEVFTGRNEVIFWEEDEGDLANLAESLKHLNHVVQNYKRGQTVWGQSGIAVSATGKIESSLYSGEKFDSGVTVISLNRDTELAALLAYCQSGEFEENLRRIDSKLSITTSTTLKVPYDVEQWKKLAAVKYPNGLPKPYSDNPTQWIFHGHPCGSVVWDEEAKWTAHGPLRNDDIVLQVAIARLLGYRWPAELDDDMELADEQRKWVKETESLLPYVDEDGIVCIPPVRGEASAADRLLNLLAAAYGEEWSNDTMAELLKQADQAGKALDTWLRDKFFTQHFKLFKHRPFIWHIWDGLHDGFAALVNYHKLDAKLLETLIYTYLGDWISRQKQDIRNGVDGAQDKLAAAEALKKKLELIPEGEDPNDIFVRWKPLEEQPIGWDPDLNDGVRLNIRPFMSVPDVGKKGAGVLRDKPNIHWKKDLGKNIETVPWYHLFGGDRINDHHLSLAEKFAARKDIK